jgi:hypothetical protein
MRGQAHTLEGIVAALLLLTSLVFALQVTAVTPLSASTSSQQLENQQQSVAEGTLAAADEANALKPAILYGNDSADGRVDGRFGFHQTSGEAYYVNEPPRNRFGEILQGTLGDRGLAYNVYVRYQTSDGGTARQRMVYQGNPSDNAVATQRTVTLYDDDLLYKPESDGDTGDFDTAVPTGTTVKSAGDDFYVNYDADGPLFNVVEVEVVVWRQ